MPGVKKKNRVLRTSYKLHRISCAKGRQELSSDEDDELKKLMSKKLRELAAKSQPPPPRPSPRDAVVAKLFDRGDEVLAAAEAQFPSETRVIIGRLAELYTSAKLTARISGGELLYLFRRLGLDVRIETSIKVEEHGKFVDLSEKLKSGKY